MARPERTPSPNWQLPRRILGEGQRAPVPLRGEQPVNTEIVPSVLIEVQTARAREPAAK